MNRTVILAVGIAALLSGAIVRADMKGSAHDFSSQAWSGGQICTVCHTPHNTKTVLMPLWNHDQTRSAFTLYSSATLKGSEGQPTGTSKACLSCHDGTVALDSFGGKTGASFVAGADQIGSDLSNDHPVSITYDSALAGQDRGLRDPATSPLPGLGGTIRDDLLFDGKMECASCHDVHNAHNQPALLVKSNAGSALCLTCHNR